MPNEPMQTKVLLLEEHKAVLAAICNVTGPYCNRGKNITLSQVITGGLNELAKRMENSPDYPKATLYVLNSEEVTSFDSALVGMRSSGNEDKDPVYRDFFMPKDLVRSLDEMSKFFDKSWVLSGRGIDDHAFSYEGREGRAKLVFSHSLYYLVNTIFGRSDLHFPIETYSRGKYLKKDGTYIYRLMDINDKLIINGNEAYSVKRYDVVIHINQGNVSSIKVGNEDDAELSEDSPDKSLNTLNNDVDYDVEVQDGREIPNVPDTTSNFDTEMEF